LLSKWVGESERGIREIFRRARQAAPCVVFFDEIDSVAPTRGGIGMGEGGVGIHTGTERMVSQLLTEMDGIQEMHGVVIIAATNRIDMIDTAFLRPGRFDKIIYVSSPDVKTREKILQIYTKGKPISRDLDIKKIADKTEGFSGADVSAIVNTAISLVLHEYLQRYPSPEEAAKNTSKAIVSMQHFEEAVKKIKTQRETKLGQTVALSHYR
jgi:transitional endoplasmic reticulum ATPase